MSKAPKIGRFLLLIGSLLLAFGLLFFSKQTSQGAKKGIDICLSVVIPSLFPFMILSSFLSQSSVSQLLSKPFSPIVTRVFKLDPQLGTIVFMSFIGGYPIGAKMISSLVKQKTISEQTASRMLCFCINAGPSFLISAVGTQILGSTKAGVLLYLSQLLASVTIAVFLPRSHQDTESYHPVPGASYAGVFVQSVYDSCDAMLRSCGLIIFFSALLPLLVPSFVPDSPLKAIITGFLEVTSGCVSAAECPEGWPYLLLPLFVSFSGLSVIFQVSSYFLNTSVNLKPFYFSRFISPLLTLLYFYPLFLLLAPIPAEHMVMTGSPLTAARMDLKSVVITLCLLGMVCIFLLSMHTRLFSKNVKFCDRT